MYIYLAVVQGHYNKLKVCIDCDRPRVFAGKGSSLPSR